MLLLDSASKIFESILCSMCRQNFGSFSHCSSDHDFSWEYCEVDSRAGELNKASEARLDISIPLPCGDLRGHWSGTWLDTLKQGVRQHEQAKGKPCESSSLWSYYHFTQLMTRIRVASVSSDKQVNFTHLKDALQEGSNGPCNVAAGKETLGQRYAYKMHS